MNKPLTEPEKEKLSWYFYGALSALEVVNMKPLAILYLLQQLGVRLPNYEEAKGITEIIIRSRQFYSKNRWKRIND